MPEIKTLYATMTALPGQRQFVADALCDLAESVRAEPGNLRFEVYSLKDDPDTFHVEETYYGEEGFKAHMGTEHGKAFNKAIIDKVANGASNVVFLENVGVTLGK